MGLGTVAAELIALYDAGQTTEQIAKRRGLPMRSIRSYKCRIEKKIGRRLGSPSKRLDFKSKTLTERQHQLIDLHSRGLWDREIGERLGITARSVCTWRRRLKARGIVFGKKRPEKKRVIAVPAEPKPKGRFCFECGARCIHVG